MGLDEATKQIYRRTDTATLVGLLPELRRLNKGAQKERERVEQERSENNDTDQRFAADLSVYVARGMERELWIRNELKRRGLLPLWPGEAEHLDDDA